MFESVMDGRQKEGNGSTTVVYIYGIVEGSRAVCFFFFFFFSVLF